MNENYQNIDLMSGISVMTGKFPAISEITSLVLGDLTQKALDPILIC